VSRFAVPLIVLVLVAATSAAFTVSERLKIERAPVTSPRFDRAFSPTCDCPAAVGRLELTLRRADRVDAEIVDVDGRVVRTLAAGERLRRGPAAFEWDGRTDGGAVAADGLYRLRVTLAREGRTITVPTTIRIETQPPELELVRVRPEELSPDGDGVHDRLKVVYRSSERAMPILSVDGEVVNRGRFWPKGRASINWSGLVDGRALEPGEHVVSLVVVDPLGNRSQPAEATIRVAGEAP
jgi:hypothetical protein